MLALSPSMQLYGDNGRKISTILFRITAPHQQFLSGSEGVEVNLMETELQMQFHAELLQRYHELQTVSPDEEFSVMVSNLDLEWKRYLLVALESVADYGKIQLNLTGKLIGALRTFVYSEQLVSYDSELVSIFEDITTLLV